MWGQCEKSIWWFIFCLIRGCCFCCNHRCCCWPFFKRLWLIWISHLGNEKRHSHAIMLGVWILYRYQISAHHRIIVHSTLFILHILQRYIIFKMFILDMNKYILYLCFKKKPLCIVTEKEISNYKQKYITTKVCSV